MSAYTKIYHDRREKGLCVRCGLPAADGRTRCGACAEAENRRMRRHYHSMSAEKRQERNAYIKAWLADHPENVAVYKSRKREYNRRYEDKL